MTSIQIAALKAYVDKVFDREIPVRTYSVFMNVLYRMGPGFFEDFGNFEEYSYFFICLRRYLLRAGTDRNLTKLRFDSLLAKLNRERSKHLIVARDTPYPPLTKTILDRLEKITGDYVERAIVPRLSKKALNVVGFTLNYHQVYASLYIARYLKDRHPDRNVLFLFGGDSVLRPRFAEIVGNFGLQGLCVMGEGERKLETVLRKLKDMELSPRDDVSAILGRLVDEEGGVYQTRGTGINFFKNDPKYLKGQFAGMGDFPDPDFEEHFASLKKIFPDPADYNKMRERTAICLEGTRGCFAKCDFCNLNTTWVGFRKRGADAVARQAITLCERHGSQRLEFVDNVCDTFAEEFSDILRGRRIKYYTFMELRAHHPETFWTKLSLAGVHWTQVGVEAISPSLLKAMGKGTTVRQNILVQKWQRELGIDSSANLITHHPRSTLADVRETKRIIEAVPHLGRFFTSTFGLALGSPIYNELAPSEWEGLKGKQWFDFPKSLKPYLETSWAYETPKKWIDKKVMGAWDAFKAWYKKFLAGLDGEAFLNLVRYSDGTILVVDNRHGRYEEHRLHGDFAAVYEACHTGPRFEFIVQKTALPEFRVSAVLENLLKKNLLLETQGFYIALALRPRDELIANLHDSEKAAIAKAAMPVADSASSPFILPEHREQRDAFVV